MLSVVFHPSNILPRKKTQYLLFRYICKLFRVIVFKFDKVIKAFILVCILNVLFLNLNYCL